MIYAGIGSRETPYYVCQRMTVWSSYLAAQKLTLRSGRAAGADTAFETGCGSLCEIFERKHSVGRDDWFRHAEMFHPAWDRCSDYAKGLHARNSPIMLGENLDCPVNFVLCWTKDGKAIGGTGQALRIAAHHEIPVFNWFNPNCEIQFKAFLIERGFR